MFRMVRTYQRKSDRAGYSAEALSNALDAIKRGEMSKKRASIEFGIPRTTLIKRLKNVDHQPSSLGRFKRIFDNHFENDLVQHAIEMQNRFYGLSLLDLRSLAFELAERNGIENPFDKEKKIAGEAWAYGFMKRHSQLSLRCPEATSMARLAGFNHIQVGRFFDILKHEYEKDKFTAAQIYNVDESGITGVQKPGKIIAQKGSKQVGKVVSAERGQTITVVCSMSAAGTYVPPMFLFKRVYMNASLANGAPPGSLCLPSASGWMDSQLFVRYMTHFIEFTRPSESKPILLIYDGHQSHKSLEVVQLARENYNHCNTSSAHEPQTATARRNVFQPSKNCLPALMTFLSSTSRVNCVFIYSLTFYVEADSY
jgi:hypothetical protein